MEKSQESIVAKRRKPKKAKGQKRKKSKKPEQKKAFSMEQPIEGERVAYCVHEAISQGTFQGDAEWAEKFGPNKKPGKMHFFLSKFTFTRPDGSDGNCTWAVICDECYKNQKRGQQFLIGGDGIWQGNAPVILERSKK
jgi:hypothetical protein